MPVLDLEMGFEKIVKLAHARGGKGKNCSARGVIFEWSLILT